jgi:hypothetical protein
MAYDFHVVRSSHWMDAWSSPITKIDVDALIDGDPELAWSGEDFVDMADESGNVTRYYMILWNGLPCFWWFRDQILCSGPDDVQLLKLVRIASALSGHVVGDDGEGYQLRKQLFGREKIVRVEGGLRPGP